MFNESMLSFRKFCLVSKTLPPELHLKLCDIKANAGKYFLNPRASIEVCLITIFIFNTVLICCLFNAFNIMAVY